MLFQNLLNSLALSSFLLPEGALSNPVGKFGQLVRDYKTASRHSHGPIQRRVPQNQDDDDDDDETPERNAPASSFRFLTSQTSGE
jgi:hypothetical protein